MMVMMVFEVVMTVAVRMVGWGGAAFCHPLQLRWIKTSAIPWPLVAISFI